MIIKNCNFISNIKKILKFLSNILAWGPAIIAVSYTHLTLPTT